jgi:hypothetical protein
MMSDSIDNILDDAQAQEETEVFFYSADGRTFMSQPEN